MDSGKYVQFDPKLFGFGILCQRSPGAQCGDTLLCRTGLTDFEGLPRDVRWGIQNLG